VVRPEVGPVIRRAEFAGWCRKVCARHTCAATLLLVNVRIELTLKYHDHRIPGVQERAVKTGFLEKVRGGDSMKEEVGDHRTSNGDSETVRHQE
jgi:hypothetical protein